MNIKLTSMTIRLDKTSLSNVNSTLKHSFSGRSVGYLLKIPSTPPPPPLHIDCDWSITN